jgi:hypothetical protein
VLAGRSVPVRGATSCPARASRRRWGRNTASCATTAAPVSASFTTRARLTCAAQAIVPLPLLRALNVFERMYIMGGKTKQKLLLLAEWRTRAGAGAPFATACFHLDTAGGNAHRATQVEAIAAALRDRDLHPAFVACGDHQRLRVAPPARGAARVARAAGRAGGGRSRDRPDALLRPPERAQGPAPGGRAAGQAGHRPAPPLTTSSARTYRCRRAARSPRPTPTTTWSGPGSGSEGSDAN